MTIHMTVPEEMPGGSSAVTPARVVALSERQSAIFYDTALPALPKAARISANCEGRAFDGPVATTRLGRYEGGERHVLLVAMAAGQICNSSIRIEADGRPLAAIDPLALQSPLVDPNSLVSGLDEVGTLRLLKLLLTTGASLFGKGDLGGFGVLVGQLVESVTHPVPLSAVCPVGRRSAILSWRLPSALEMPAMRDLCVLHGGRASRFTDFEVIQEGVGDKRLLHLLTSRPLPEGADLMILGDRPVRLAGPRAEANRPVRGWLARRSHATRAQTLDWLDGLASGDAEVAALRDELACPEDSEPRLGVLHLSETPKGLLYLFAVDDPRGLLAGIRISSAGQAVDVPCGRLEWHAQHGAVVAGFSATTGRSGGSASIAPVFLSGRIGSAVDSAPAAFDGVVPDVFRGLPPSVAAPALACALPAAIQARPVWRRRVTEYGAFPSAPGVAVLIEAGDAPEHLHAVMSRLLAEPGGRNAEIVVHHADGPSTEMVRQAVDALAAVHRIGIRLVSVAPASFASERLRSALAETRAPRALALGAGAVPSAPGWLVSWRRRISAGPSPVAVWLPCSAHDGAARDGGEAIGFNSAAVARLVSTRARLSGVGPDVRATEGMDHATARGLSVTVFEDVVASDLVRFAELIATEALTEGTDG